MRAAYPFLALLLVLTYESSSAAPPEPPRSLGVGPTTGPDLDTDGDGLSDFQEAHKYRTDPAKKHTAGDPKPDGDWDQRREHTYSVRSVIRILRPVNKAALNDDYHDVRVLAENERYLDLEVISYPLNTNADAIVTNPTWKKDYAGMKEYLDPGVCTNWDAGMRDDLLQQLAAAGIDPDKLTDREVVEKVSRWLRSSSKYRYMFGTFFVHFPDGKPALVAGLERSFDREKGDPRWTPAEQFEHELLGRQMFQHKTYGTCTSFAVYQTTVLRALGIPTRMILTIPVVDPNDEAQLAMLEKGLTHHQVRKTAYEGSVRAGQGFMSHTYNEVYVGNRWRRLNYSKLGQNILDAHYFGLMVHVHTFRDLSDANLAATWGTRYGHGERDENFRTSNPYRTLELSDHFGRHADVPNTPADVKEHRQITVSKAYWLGADGTPEPIRSAFKDDDGAGHLFIHGEEWFKGEDHLQYKVFMKRADKEFVLRAPGQPDVKASVSGNFYTLETPNLREMEVVVPPAELAKLARDVAYTLHPVNAKPGYQWKVRGGVTVTRK